MDELGVSDGGMFKCSEDHFESREEHSKRQGRGTSPRRSEAQGMRSSLKASRYRKLKSVKGSVGHGSKSRSQSPTRQAPFHISRRVSERTRATHKMQKIKSKNSEKITIIL